MIILHLFIHIYYKAWHNMPITPRIGENPSEPQPLWVH